jgi:hypothetical protein
VLGVERKRSQSAWAAGAGSGVHRISFCPSISQLSLPSVIQHSDSAVTFTTFACISLLPSPALLLYFHNDTESILTINDLRIIVEFSTLHYHQFSGSSSFYSSTRFTHLAGAASFASHEATAALHSSKCLQWILTTMTVGYTATGHIAIEIAAEMIETLGMSNKRKKPIFDHLSQPRLNHRMLGELPI